MKLSKSDFHSERRWPMAICILSGLGLTSLSSGDMVWLENSCQIRQILSTNAIYQNTHTLTWHFLHRLFTQTLLQQRNFFQEFFAHFWDSRNAGASGCCMETRWNRNDRSARKSDYFRSIEAEAVGENGKHWKAWRENFWFIACNWIFYPRLAKPQWSHPRRWTYFFGDSWKLLIISLTRETSYEKLFLLHDSRIHFFPLSNIWISTMSFRTNFTNYLKCVGLRRLSHYFLHIMALFFAFFLIFFRQPDSAHWEPFNTVPRLYGSATLYGFEL